MSNSDSPLKDGLKTYEKAVNSAHRALLILCVVSAACLGLARTPSLVADKVGSVAGAEVRGEAIPVGSYAVVLGCLAIPVLVQWCYRAVIRAIAFSYALTPSGSPPGSGLEREQLALPLLGSPTAWQLSWIARCELVLVLVTVALGPLVCDGMLLWDYSNQFSFPEHLKQFHGPWGLWFNSAGSNVVRPTAFNSRESHYHPALLPPWQAWLYLALLIWAALLVVDMYRWLFMAMIRSWPHSDGSTSPVAH